MHCGDGVALALRAYALAPDSTEFVVGYSGSTAKMLAFQIASKDENFAAGKLCDESLYNVFIGLIHNIMRFH